MKILYLNANAALGGAEMVLLDLMAALRAERPDWGLSLVVGEDGPLVEEAGRLGVSSEVLGLPPAVARLGDSGAREGARGRLALAARMPAAFPAAAGYLGRLGRAIRRQAPDLLHTNGMKAHVLGAWAAPRRVPVLWHLHDYAADRPVMARLLAIGSRRRRLSAVGVSGSVADDARTVLNPRVPVRAIYNAIDLGRFAAGPASIDLDGVSGLPTAPEGTVRVGLVATFARWKGHDVFLEAASLLPADRPCRFYIVGGPIYRSLGSQWSVEELRALADRAGVSDRVGFAGFLDPAEAMRALDVVVHASTRAEPFGRVIVEGMACGRAVVAMLGGGSGELFEDGREALGCPRGDARALASAMDRLVLDAPLRARLGGAGVEAARRRFDRLSVAGSWIASYESAIAPASAAGR